MTQKVFSSLKYFLSASFLSMQEQITEHAHARVDGKRNIVIIKRNYSGEGVDKQAVANDPGKRLEAVTVMYKRPGYDEDNRDWFWVKYAPDGDMVFNHDRYK